MRLLFLSVLAAAFMNAASAASDATGMIPFVAVTGRPTEAEVRAKVASIRAQRMDSFFIYARSGLELEYMGEKWLDVCAWFCDEAERRGMKVWLYDEYNWPSGTCKGRVPAENDAWRYAELGVYRDDAGKLRWIKALAPQGWVNVCEKDAVRRFIELTHEVYRRRLARWFENGTIVGIFTDEPGHSVKVTFPEGETLVSCRTYSGMEDEYRAAVGRNFREDVEKWLETGAGDVWSDYLAVMGQRFRSAYFDQLREWCDRNGVFLTGHLIGENALPASARYNGNPVLCLRGESLPGMDEIGTAYDASPGARPPIEWVTYNLARQAVIYRGNGGMAELFACGPADHVPSTLRFGMWMCAFHGIDRYLTCMDVMDERGLVEKHGYLAPAGPVHPWYEKYAHILADEARTAALWARKPVVGREVAVRYPNREAARVAVDRKLRNTCKLGLNRLLGELELNQMVCRIVDEGERSDLPLVFVCNADGTFAEERSGKDRLDIHGALELCRTLPASPFEVRELYGSPARDILVRSYADGSAAVLNARAFVSRTLKAVRGSEETTFVLEPRGVALFSAGALPPPVRMPSSAHSLQNVKWSLALDAPNIRRINFGENRKGEIVVASELKNVRLVTRELAMSYAVTASGRPVGINEAPEKGETVIRHIAEPYSFRMDGKKIDSSEVSTSLRPGFDTLYRQTGAVDLAAGVHGFEIVTGESDSNYFLPAMFITGDFAVWGGVVHPRPRSKVPMGPLSAAGLGDFTGTATWTARLKAPEGREVGLRLVTGNRVARVRFAGRDLGVRAWPPFEWIIPSDLVGIEGLLEISITTSVQPMFGDSTAGKWDTKFWLAVNGPDGPAGLLAADWLTFTEIEK